MSESSKESVIAVQLALQDRDLDQVVNREETPATGTDGEVANLSGARRVVQSHTTTPVLQPEFSDHHRLTSETPSIATLVGEDLVPPPSKRRRVIQCGGDKGIATSAKPITTAQLVGALLCPICLDVPRNAVATPCGHLMCGGCLFACVKTEALRAQEVKQQEQRLAVLINMARGLPPPDSLTALSGSSTRSQILYFLSPGQIAEVVETAIVAATQQALTTLITVSRATPNTSAHSPWFKFLCHLLGVILSSRKSFDLLETTVDTNPFVQKVVTYLAEVSPTDLASLLCARRNPNGPIEEAIIEANSKLTVTNEGQVYLVEESSVSGPHLDVIWSLFHDSADLANVYEQVAVARKLASTFQTAKVQMGLREPTTSRTVPDIRHHPNALDTVVEFVHAYDPCNVLNSATSIPSPAVYEMLDRLSACLWGLHDPSRTFDQFFVAAQSQRADAIRRRDPHSLSGLRLTADELDPMVGYCPVCRHTIPGGFFGKLKNRGVQGLKFKMGVPSDSPVLPPRTEFDSVVSGGNFPQPALDSFGDGSC